MLWDEIAGKAKRAGTRIRNVYQEEMQKAVITSMSMKGCFEKLVFQGGTALRLFYGNPRFSEDIDLVLNEGVVSYDISSAMASASRFCRDTFPFLQSIEVRAQKIEPPIQRYVLRAESDYPEQNLRLHIELVPVPSYLSHPRILDFPPIQPAVRVEDMVEILADKICALAFRPYLKGRDLWDIHFLTEERSIDPDWDLVWRKVRDYNMSMSDMMSGLIGTDELIRSEGIRALESELGRFLPKPVFEIYRSHYDQIVASVLELILQTEKALEAYGHDDR